MLWALTDRHGTIRDRVRRDANGVTVLSDHVDDAFGSYQTPNDTNLATGAGRTG